MQEKEIFLSLDILAKMGAYKELLEFFKERYSNDSATLSGVISDLQESVSTSTKGLEYIRYAGYAKWLFGAFPPTQEPLVLSELNRKVIIHNGAVNIKSGIDGDPIIISNGDLDIDGKANLSGHARIWASGAIDIKNIKTDDSTDIWSGKSIKAINIAAKGHGGIRARNIIDATNVALCGCVTLSTKDIKTKNLLANGHVEIWAERTIDTVYIAVREHASIMAYEINTQKIMDESKTRVLSNINLIKPSSNQ